MRILYDGQIYGIAKNRGINRYFQNLIQHLPTDFVPTITTIDSDSDYPVHSNLKLRYCQRNKFLPQHLFTQYENLYFRAVALLGRFNVVHPTYYVSIARHSISSFHSRLKYPVVITVHDMLQEIFPNQLDPSGEQRSSKREGILAAQSIICVSENTKRDLIEHLSIPEEKITVTHLASNINASLSYGSEPVPSDSYYLYVGGREYHKNFNRCLKAFAQAVSVKPELFLCIVGAPFNQSEQKLIAQLGLEQQIQHYGYAGDHHLAKLYRCSIGLIYPSLYEGFGIPPLEAMSCGTVAITSNCSSLPEVVGDAGILLDPTSTTDLTEILLWLSEHSSERDRLIQQGYEQAKRFSWQQTAAKTVEVYASVAG